MHQIPTSSNLLSRFFLLVSQTRNRVVPQSVASSMRHNGLNKVLVLVSSHGTLEFQGGCEFASLFRKQVGWYQSIFANALGMTGGLVIGHRQALFQILDPVGIVGGFLGYTFSCYEKISVGRQ